MARSKTKHPGSGYHYILCDVCGFKVRRKDAKERWDNLLVCPKDFEEQHPQERVVITRSERPLAPRDSRPESEDQFGTGSIDDL